MFFSSQREKVAVGILAAIAASPYLTDYYLRKQPDPLVNNFLQQTKQQKEPFHPTNQQINRNYGMGDASIELTNDRNGDKLSFKANQSHFIWFYDQASALHNDKPIDTKLEPYDDQYYNQTAVTTHTLATYAGNYAILALGLLFCYSGLKGRVRIPFRSTTTAAEKHVK
jgi:hypothetical protein